MIALNGHRLRETSARRLLDLLGEARGAQEARGVPQAVSRGAQRVDTAAFERAPRDSARYAPRRGCAPAAEHPVREKEDHPVVSPARQSPRPNAVNRNRVEPMAGPAMYAFAR
jgi:hypothetical protein